MTASQATLTQESQPAASENSEATGLPVLPVLGFLTAWLGGSWLIVGALLNNVMPGGWFSVAAIGLLFAVPVRILIRGFSGAAYPSAAMRLFVLRPFWYAMLFLPLLAGAGLLGVLVGLPFGASGAVGRWVLGSAAALLAGAAAVGFAGTRRLVERHLDARLPGLASGLDGMRIVQLSDLHVGPHTSSQFLARIAAAVRSAKPDLIAITGDQVDDYTRDIEYFGSAFGNLSAPRGVFAVAGNHDVYAGWEGVRAGMEKLGMSVLVNDAVLVKHNGARLWLAGTGDPAANHWTRGGGALAAPDIERTLASIPEGEPTVALAHNPALWPALAERGVELTLSGHTHYGQFAVPSWGWSVASRFLDLAMGAHHDDGSLLYINPGTNFWGIPFRIGTYPEVSVITLRSSEDGEAEVVPSAAH